MLPSNNPDLQSWVKVAAKSDFPIQNLPFGIFRKPDKKPRAGVAIGDQVLDLAKLHSRGFLDSCGIKENVFKRDSLNDFLALGKEKCRDVRERLSELLRKENKELQIQTEVVEKVLVPMKKVELLLPVKPTDYTDFYSSMEHATNVGMMFRDPENALLPNWKHLPVGYHGRSSSIVPSGVNLRRPKGQTKGPNDEVPTFGPSKRVDFELEMAFITCGSTALGESISTHRAEDYIFGFSLFNDWSARDIQAWEYVPLGPFLAKNWGSSMAPWIVTMDALEPFRVAGPKQEPEVLPYLQYEGKWNYDIDLEVLIQPEGSEPQSVCRSNFRYMYWNVLQQLAHHTVNGCNINGGDVYASGTISGPDESSYGSMLELAWKGTRPLALENGLERSFIEDNDTVIMKGVADNGKQSIGFGEVKAKILPANE